MSIHDADTVSKHESSACNSTQSIIHVLDHYILTICLSITNSIISDSFIVLGTLLVPKCSIRRRGGGGGYCHIWVI